MASSSGCVARAEKRSWPVAGGRDASVSRPEAPTLDQRFPRSCRLTTRRQFLHVYDEGRRVGSKSLTLYGLPNQLDHCRLGLTASRKVGGAVRRNRVKRMLRQIFRANRMRMSPPLDVVVNAHRSIHERTTRELEDEFLRSFSRLAARFES